MKFLFTLFLLFTYFLITAQVPVYPAEGNISNNKYQHIQGFIKNDGQVKGLNNDKADFVYYTAVIGDKQVALTNYGISYLSYQIAGSYKQAFTQQFKHKKNISQKQYIDDSIVRYVYNLQRTDMVLEGAVINPENIIESAPNAGPRYNYYFKTKTFTLKPSLKVLVKNIYPGIDWLLYVNINSAGEEFFTYDFIVNPGGDIKKIKFHYSDDVSVSLQNKDGNLAVSGKLLTLNESAPLAYIKSNRQNVEVHYMLKNKQVSFDAASYKSPDTLVIDPDVYWATYVSSTQPGIENQYVIGGDIEADITGNIFATVTVGPGVPFPVVNPGKGAYYENYDAPINEAAAIMKFAPGGQLLWSTLFGDNNTEGRLITVSKNGDVYLVGNCGTIPLKDGGGFYDTGANRSYFIARFTNDGQLLWSSYLSAGEMADDITTDAFGNVFIAGWSADGGIPTVDPGNGAYVVINSKYPVANTLYIMEINDKNNYVWSTRVEGDDDDDGDARVCTDKLGNVYLGGSGGSDNYPLVNAGGYFNDSIDDYRNFLTKFDVNRKMVWSTIIPGISLSDFDCDDSSNLYVATSRTLLKFDTKTDLVWQRSLNFTRQYFYSRLMYNKSDQQVQLLGIMNDVAYDFPTINTLCNNSFFSATSPQATDPFFVTYTTDGDNVFTSLVYWPYDYYDCDFTIDGNGNPIYMFFGLRNSTPEPSLTDPGNGAYYQPKINYGGTSCFIMKLTSSGISAQARVSPPATCGCTGAANITVNCGQYPIKYQWSNGDTTSSENSLCPGSYWVKLTDAVKQTKLINIYVTQPSNGIKSVVYNAGDENCDKQNGYIKLTGVVGGTGPYTYSINNSNYTQGYEFYNLSSSSPNIITVKDVNNCTLNDTITLNNIPGPQKIFATVSATSCDKADGIITVDSVLSSAFPYTYSINNSNYNANNTFTSLAAANYILSVHDSAGCSLDSTFKLQKSMPPDSALIYTAPDHCNLSIGSINVQKVYGGISPFYYSLDSLNFTTSGDWQNLATAAYKLFIKDSKGCFLIERALNISSISGPANISFSQKDAVCGSKYGMVNVGSVQGGVSPYMYKIDNGTYQSNSAINNVLFGLHAITVKDTFDCTYTDSFQIKYQQSPVIVVSPGDTTVCYGKDITFKLTTDNQQLISKISWNYPSFNNYGGTVNAQDNENIIATVTDINNCILFDTALLKVKACNTPDKCVYFPSAFTPNNDSRNDFAGPIINGCRVSNLHFSIYNRFGQLIFQSSSVSNKWDGRYRGKEQPMGTYIYTCEFTGADDVSRIVKGTIVLLR